MPPPLHLAPTADLAQSATAARPQASPAGKRPAANVSGLGSLDVRNTDLPDATLGLASGNTIALDSSAAGWELVHGSLVAAGTNTQAGRMDLLSALTTG